MSVHQKLAMLKIRSKSVTFLNLGNLEAAPERGYATQEADQELK